MIALVLVTFVDLFVTIFNLLLLTRVISSYVANPHGRFYMGLVSITEPVLLPVRKLMPATPGIDLAPLVAFFLLQGFQYGVHWLVQA
jgi:YggT family protein